MTFVAVELIYQAKVRSTIFEDPVFGEIEPPISNPWIISNYFDNTCVYRPLYPWHILYRLISSNRDCRLCSSDCVLAKQLVLNRPDIQGSYDFQLKWISSEIWISRHFSSDSVAQRIAKSIYLGNDVRGLRDGSYYHFQKKWDALSVREQAQLLCATKSPTRVNPSSQEEDLVECADALLNELLDKGLISREQLLQ